MKNLLLRIVLVLAMVVIAHAAPFDQQIHFTQPGGDKITLHGWGDEFSAVFETLEGYTAIFDSAQRAYCYADVDANGNLVSTGVPVSSTAPAPVTLNQHVRMRDDVHAQQVAQRSAAWEKVMQIQPRWKAKLAAMHQLEGQPAAAAEAALSPAELQAVSHTTLGNKMGLTILIDFDDDPATIPQAEIVNYCNADNYTGYGNNGSLRKYYLDNSNGRLNYSNVVTMYIRIPNSVHPKSYYNDVTVSAGTCFSRLLNDAWTILTNTPNYASQILPTFAGITTNSDGSIVATSIFFAGDNSGVWTFGLWPVSGMYGGQQLGNGMHIGTFCGINIGDSLTIGTFCHENGHMLCGYPDVYAYTGGSGGGAGSWCLMASGNYNGGSCNPSPIDAYLKRASGWANTIDVTSSSSMLASMTWADPEPNTFYRFQKPGVSTEYYLAEMRQRTGRGADNAGAGVLLWRVDELGNHDYWNTNCNTTHTNYEVYLVQADNLYQIQNNVNDGDANDPFYKGNPSAGYANLFSDNTAPGAGWYDCTASGLVFADFSSNAPTMTFRIGTARLPLNVVSTTLVDANGNDNVDPNEACNLYIVLQNTDTRTATNISATIYTTTAGVALGTATANFPDAAPGAFVTNTAPFTFNTSSGFVCGTTVQFTNVATFTGGSTTSTFALTSTAPCVDGSLTPPTVALTSPANAQVFAAGNDITLTATATPGSSAISSVSFYDGATLLTTVSSAPYTYTWSGATAGAHTVKARALDANGLFAVATANIGVSAGGAMTWIGQGSSDNWSDIFNWNLYRAPINGEAVVFSGGTRLTPANDSLTSLGAVTLNNGGFVIGGNWLTLNNGITSAGNSTWNVISKLGAAQSFLSSSGTLTIGAVVTNGGYNLAMDGAGNSSLGYLTGSGALIKNGSGTLTNTMLCDYSGGTTVNAGRLVVAAGASGSVRAIGSGLLTVNNGATVEFVKSYGFGGTSTKPATINGGTIQLDDFNYVGALNMTGGSVIGVGSLSSLSSHTINAAATTAMISVPFKMYWSGDNTFTVADGAADPDLSITSAITEQNSPANLVKTGAGRMVIAGGTYTGNTVVKAGTLDVWGALGGSIVTVSNGAALTVKVFNSGATISAPGLALGSASGVTALNFINFAGSGTPPINVITFTANGTVTINLSGGFAVGQYPLIKYSALAGTGFSALHLGALPPGVTANLVNNTGNLSVDLNITAVSPVIWSGVQDANWNIAASTNWYYLGTNFAYLDGEAVLLDDTATGSTTITLTTNVAPGSVLANNNSKSYTLTGSGALTGGAGLTKQGSGTLVIGTTNSYAGATTIAGGTVQLGNTAALGTGALTVNAGTLDLNGNWVTAGSLSGSGGVITDNSSGYGATILTVNQTVSGAYAGSIADGSAKPVSVVKKGSGTLTLSGANTFSGVLADEGLSGVNDGAILIATSAAVQNVSQINLYNVNMSTSSLQLDGSGGSVAVGAPIALDCRDGSNSVPVIENLAGNNTLAGNISTSSGDPNNLIQSDAGTLTLGGILSCRNGAATYTIQGSGNVTVSGTFQGLSANAVTVLKTNSGALTLSGPQTHTGGTVLAGGQLNLNSVTALGANGNAFTNAAASTIDNTSGTAVMIANNNPEFWNADFTFAGSNPLNLGSGAVTLGAGRQVTVAASVLTVGGAISGSGCDLTKTGGGTLVLAGTNTYTGTTTVSAGALNVTGKLVGGGAVNVADGASLLLNAGKGLTASGLSLGTSGATTLNLSNFTGGASAPVTATTLTPNGTVTLNIAGSAGSPGQYPLISYTSLGGAGFSAFTLGSKPATWFSVSLVNNTANKSVDVLIGAMAPGIVSVTPVSTNVYAGSSVMFTVSANGSLPAYQWQYNGANIAGANGATFTVASAQATNSGWYRVVITNSYGAVTSSVCSLTVTPSQPYRAQLLAGSPVAWWRLNETNGTIANDCIGGFNGTNNGSLSLGVSGPSASLWPGFESANTAYSFSGSGTSVSLPALNLSSNITLTAWVKPNADPGYYSGVISWNNGGGTIISLGFGNHTPQLYYMRNGYIYSSSSLLVPTNQWSLVALVATPTNAVLYLATNSTLISYNTGTVNPALTSFTGLAYIGNNSGYGRYSGSIDEVAIYNQMLSPTQITNLAAAAATAMPVVTLDTPADGGSLSVASTTLAASVTANGHTINAVKFYDGAALLGQDGSAPYQLTWSATHGNHTLLAQVIYDSTNSVSSSPVNITVTNRPPVANVLNLTRTAGMSLKLALSDLATNWNDADGDAISLMGVNLISTNGANLCLMNVSTNGDGSWLIATNAFIGYTNNLNVADQFGYTIADGFGGTAIGLINIAISTNAIAGQVTGIISPVGNAVGLNFAGLPGYAYNVERSTNLMVNWKIIWTTNAPAAGLFNFLDTFGDLGAPPASAYYRLSWQQP